MSDLDIWVTRSGDPASFDFDEGDLTADGTWRDLDLSSIVPAGATAVAFYLLVQDSTTNILLSLRQNGLSNAANIVRLYNLTSTIPNSAFAIVACDSSRVIEYWLSNTTWTSVRIHVVGWFIPLSASGLVDFTANATPSIDDLVYTVNDPGGTPADRKVTAQNFLTLAPHFVDRGDPAAYDFQVGDLTTDGTWRDLDLSSIVPAGTTHVYVRLVIQDDAANSSILLRENGNSNAYNIGVCRTQVANQINDGFLLVPCDSSRVIEYNATNTTWDMIDILVTGWIIDTIN